MNEPLQQLVRRALRYATPERLAWTLLREDTQFERIPRERVPTLLDAALADGTQRAARTSCTLGTDPDAIARALRLPVEDVDADAGYGRTIVYAAYLTTPPRVQLYEPRIRTLARRLDAPGLAAMIGVADVRAIYLAHEIYHHLDQTRSGPALAAQHRVPIVKLGGWAWTSGLASLAEVAAGAFAQSLLGLRYHPRLLDLFALFEASPAAARAWVDKLAETPQSTPTLRRAPCDSALPS